jgi:hypothetical protein
VGLSAAGHAATDRGTRLHGHAAPGRGRSLGRGEHRGGQRMGSWIVVVVEVARSGPTSRSPTTCVDCGKPRARSSANWSPSAADRSPHVPRRHAARRNQRGWRHRRGYDQIQPPTAASNSQIQAGDLSAAPQSRAWTADNTGLPRQQRPCRYWVVAVAVPPRGRERRASAVTKDEDSSKSARRPETDLRSRRLGEGHTRDAHGSGRSGAARRHRG